MNRAQALELLERKNLYPVIGTEPQEYIPYTAIAPHERRAVENHAQTLLELAVRGGLAWCELLAVLTDRSWMDTQALRPEEARAAVLSLIKMEEEKK